MTAPAHALLAAVLARPDDDAPRLAYADALGDAPRAGFIRRQCEAAALPRRHPRALRLAAHDGPLAYVNASAWSNGLSRLAEVVGYRRGFAEVIRSDASDFERHGNAMLACAPVRELLLRTGPFVATPPMRHLRRLHLPLATGRLAELGTTEHLPELRTLSFDALTSTTDGSAARAFAGSRSLAGLENLALYGARTTVFDEALADADGLPSLRRLALWDPRLGSDALLSGPLARRLEGLRLAAGAHAAPSIATLCAPRLRQLWLLDPLHVGTPEMRALAGLELPSLRELSVGALALEPDAVAALASAPWLGQLGDLRLSASLEPSGLASLLRAATGLRHLEVSAASGEGLGAVLAGAAAATTLRSLSLTVRSGFRTVVDALLSVPSIDVLFAPHCSPAATDRLTRAGFEALGDRSFGFVRTSACTTTAPA